MQFLHYDDVDTSWNFYRSISILFITKCYRIHTYLVALNEINVPNRKHFTLHFVSRIFGEEDRK